jgi:hypothetical protein
MFDCQQTGGPNVTVVVGPSRGRVPRSTFAFDERSLESHEAITTGLHRLWAG